MATVVGMAMAMRSSGAGLRRPSVAGRVQVGRIPPAAASWQNRRERLALFQSAKAGRKAVLTQVLSGMGGVGKTQLAGWFARKIRDELQVLVWVTAAGRDPIVASYAEAATALGLVDRDHDPQRAADQFLTWLEDTDQRWLVVLDNLDNLADAKNLWPPANRAGRTVVTTRRRDASLNTGSRTLIEVGLFTQAEAIDYLTRAIGDEQRMAEVTELVEDLGRLPLALAQAAAFIRERELDCAAYRRRLADQRKYLPDLLPDEGELPDEHRTTVAATWSLSITAADTVRPQGLARLVLELAALLDPNGIPTILFATEAVRNHLTSRRGTNQPVEEDDVREALRNLHRFHLATLDGDTLRVHALVQRAVRETTPEKDSAMSALTAGDALLAIWPAIESDQQTAQTLRANTASLHTASQHHLWDNGGHAVLIRAGNSLGETGQVNAAVAYFHQLHTTALTHLGFDHPYTLTTRHSIAYWRGEAGDPAGAATTFARLLTDRLRILGPDHPHTLGTRHNIAHWRGRAGDPTSAATAYEELLADYLRILGPDHPDTLSTRSNLARWRGMAGDPVGAVAALADLLADQLRVVGPDHPDTLTTRYRLASWRGESGDPAAAVAALADLLADQLRVLGPDHPHTLTTRHYLARWQGKAGDPAGAAAAFEQLLTGCLQILGPDHPHTLTTRNNLACWRGESGDPAAAVAALADLLADQLRVLGPDHPHTLTTRHDLAHWQGMAGDPAAAVAALADLLADRLRVLGPDHSHTLTTRYRLGHWQGMAGDPAAAVAALADLLADQLRVLEPGHPHTLATRHDLAYWRRRITT
ncbi:FxSxx-COOH system tetratricopeptide repeat protein [Micromonospora sp. RL09-050-HVF-A]|uniref:FxSxx-COOH system tetratricopeptide repeat protein n=1 Tax=unclassified Micromonospora TaxID=2617518 RepID=UPI001C5F4FCF|nr:FxSxx-COOH system tetratricopeptide repeat protein [Micromonospora sp. RL09-050-HVF-A]MBW4704619.1 tetratricopeptide repeat protein [Micromonospora sp. RL09-050-HVF-A]